MITGYKPSGYFETSRDGVRIEGETRQCVHCQYMWTYVPGSGATRGFCLKCNGLVCGRPECAAQQKQLLAKYPGMTAASRACIPFTDVVERQRDQWAADPRYDVRPSGIVVARD